MDKLNFIKLLQDAKNGDKKSIEKVIKMYEPLINKYSVDYSTNLIDEDCKSTIIEKIQKEIKKFKIF